MSLNKRIQIDVTKLMMQGYKLELINKQIDHFRIKIQGPKDSPYEGGEWTLNVRLPFEYPYKSPSIGFVNRIYHPNIDFRSGSVCLDVLNQTWTPVFELQNIFEIFLPQLLLYPNPNDPLNEEAAKVMQLNKKDYERKAREFTKQYAIKSVLKQKNSLGYEEDLSDLSDLDELDDLDDLGEDDFSDYDF
ncbi:ubiquitin-conjugating enzyme e2-23 kda-like [Anaeramoeba flamelloides]|uniref:Ubiquitin-conjugating enzyme e2-23 kDa-like n=1 Tax=Anaeramoeba flamelloides TaxID=1746091 RepID=A0ABQ8XRT0_9EUKA|nr:ubiquitin-conjugating enzyme e2-23 kda-like [Anaeramoeba flamelloides]